jgi:putative pyruvate formate lyase activating enzyme
MPLVPGYIRLFREGVLKGIASELEKAYRCCRLCPNDCRVDRVAGEKGKCLTGAEAVVASFGSHFGEEPPLTGFRGSGTVFFSGCNLKCIYCQNFDISQLRHGTEVTPARLADIMLSLQAQGCHNINFVTPTHVIPTIIRALTIAAEGGLSLPLVYNSSGYDSTETLRLLDGIFDIYMPDFKYAEEKSGMRLSGIKRYPEVAQNAIREMHRQVGDLKVDKQGIAVKGLIVRHLILPGHTDESKRVIDFIKSLSAGTYLNLMEQYHPEYKVFDIPGMNRMITKAEYAEVVSYALDKGITKGLSDA